MPAHRSISELLVRQSRLNCAYMRTPLLLTLAAVCMALCVGAAETKVKVGDMAPKIEAKDQSGKDWKLADAIGKRALLIYFYPKDDTPGCTKEACGLRDRMGDLKSKDVEVVGVSFDSGESHQKFISKYNLNFTLLADTDGKVADAFGVRREAGKNIARRVSFLINKEGKVVHVTDSPDAMVHLDEMSAEVDKLAKK